MVVAAKKPVTMSRIFIKIDGRELVEGQYPYSYATRLTKFWNGLAAKKTTKAKPATKAKSMSTATRR